MWNQVISLLLSAWAYIIYWFELILTAVGGYNFFFVAIFIASVAAAFILPVMRGAGGEVSRFYRGGKRHD